MEQNILSTNLISLLYRYTLQKPFAFFRLLFLLFSLLITANHLQAQPNLEFVENKGQWDKNISFQGEMTNGAFALKPDGGYRMLLYSKQGLNQMNNMIHPNETAAANFTSNKTNNTLLPQQAKAAATDFTYSLATHVYEIKFLNANPHPEAAPDKPLEKYNNYLLGTDSSKWAGNCSIFTAVTYRNIYPNIDIRYYTDKGNLKYDFIIHPGGDARNIIIYIDGADDISIKKGQLVIETSVDEVRESIPHSYTFNTIDGKKEVDCQYKLNGNIVHFDLAQTVYPKSTLIIDPQFVFSTFTGSRASNWGYTATYDGLGNFYAGGIVFGSGFRVTNGAYQTVFNGGNNSTGEGGGFDIGIMKFNANGSRVIYATYIGGSGNDYPHSLVVDANNNLIIAGKTTSSDYPNTGAHFGPGNASIGNFDIVLTKLNAAGSGLVGSRVLGGSSHDGVNIANKYPTAQPGNVGAISLRRNYGDDSRSEVIVDSVGNIYLASSTQSTDFLTTPNAFQTKPGATSSTSGRYQDGVLIKTNPDLSSILFSSFLGGNDDDVAMVLALNPINYEIAVAGGTASSDFPGDKTNVYGPTYKSGICDGFVSIISNDGSQIIHTSYFGTGAIDMIYGIQFDKFAYPYIMGTTTGTWPIKNANFVQAGSKQFICKLEKDLSDFVYSTTFGTNTNTPNISPTAFLVDRCENVYVSGWGGKGNTVPNYNSSGTKGMSVTPNAIQKSTDGSDFYFFVLQRDAVAQLYGSFFGQNGGNYPDHVDGGTSRFDKNGAIYQSLCANCGGPQGAFPTTSGVAYPNNGSSGCNLAAIKIAFNLSGVGAAIRSSIKGISNKITGCVPLTVNFTDTLGEGKQYVWDFGDNTPKVFSSTPATQHTYKQIGSYTAMLVSVDSSTCNGSDTSYLRIRVRNDEAFLSATAKKITPPCNAVLYEFTNTSVAPVTRPFLSNSFSLILGDGTQQTITSPQIVRHTYSSDGTYNASLTLTDTNYCNAPETIPIVLRIAANVKAIIKTDSLGCAPYTALLENASRAGETFYWDFGDGSPIYKGADIVVSHAYPNIGTYRIKLKAIDSSTCNIIDSTMLTLLVRPKPSAAFTVTTQQEDNDPIIFTNQSQGAVSYLWKFGDDDSLFTTQHDPPISHLYNSTQIFRAQLIAANLDGCVDTAEQDFKSTTHPYVDVAKAIVPMGKNKTVQVRGYGIVQMDWKIYNRWGQVIFATTDKNQAWDGTFKSKIQAPDVYTYTLDVTFSDGQHYSKKGDITLLR